jgi:hypothetical protein
MEKPGFRRSAAEAIARRAIEEAKSGQLAPAKNFSEAVGLYPETAETASGPEDSLAYTLLKRLGLPTEPLIGEEDTVSDSVNGLKSMMDTTADGDGIEIRNGRADVCEGNERRNKTGESRMP